MATKKYGEYDASPNSECTATVNPADLNGTETTYEGTRYGKGGKAAGTGQDASELTKIAD